MAAQHLEVSVKTRGKRQFAPDNEVPVWTLLLGSRNKCL